MKKRDKMGDRAGLQGVGSFSLDISVLSHPQFRLTKQGHNYQDKPGTAHFPSSDSADVSQPDPCRPDPKPSPETQGAPTAPYTTPHGRQEKGWEEIEGRARTTRHRSLPGGPIGCSQQSPATQTCTACRCPGPDLLRP